MNRGRLRMTCTDKFGKPVPMPKGTEPCDFSSEIRYPCIGRLGPDVEQKIASLLAGNAAALFEYLRDGLPPWTFDEFRAGVPADRRQAPKTRTRRRSAIEVLDAAQRPQVPDRARRNAATSSTSFGASCTGS